MSKTILFSFLMVFSTYLLGNGDPVIKSVTVNPANSSIQWVGKKVTGKHEGTINVQSGNLEFGVAGILVSGTVVIDMTSITCTDLSGGGAKKLVGHLNSDDFFGVANHPTATLEITGSSKNTNGSLDISGELTIKGITKPITFNAKISEGTAVATISVERTQYDIKYGSGSFFDNLGDKTIDDEFTLEVDLSFE